MSWQQLAGTIKPGREKAECESNTLLAATCYLVFRMLDISPLRNTLCYQATGVRIHYQKKLDPTQQIAAFYLEKSFFKK